jgi:proline iminopeptidase
MLRSFSFLLACALACAPVAGTRAADACLQDTGDVFNQLQQNAWYLPTADHAAQLYVTSIGNGAPVVFLHGGPGNDFQYIIDALRPQLDKHRFILFDQRGSLLSPVPDKQIGGLTVSQMVDDLETLRKALGVKKMVLFGQSFGTLLAMMYYQAHPEHVAGLVLAGTIPPTFKPGGIAGWVKAMRPRQKIMMGRTQAIAQAEMAAGLSKDSKMDTPEQASARWRISKQAALEIVDLQRWREVTGGMVYYNDKVDDAIGNTLPDGFDIGPTLATHPVPITLIQGDRDYVDPAAEAWSSYADAGKVHVDVMPAASHYAWIDDPAAFASALRSGLARADAGR